MKPQTIISLNASNIMRLKAVEITPDGNMVIIGGNNSAGKSSVLSAICMALGGKDFVPDMPIRQGETKAKVVIETQELIITRTFSAATGTALKITTKDEMPISAPQEVLNKLIGRLAFDPLSFLTTAKKEPKKAVETLRNLVGLDFTAMDADRKKHYDARTLKNRDVENLKGQLSVATHYPDAPKEEVSVQELVAQIEKAKQTNTVNAQLRKTLLSEAETQARTASTALTNSQNTIRLLESSISDLQEQIAALQKKLTGLTTSLTDERQAFGQLNVEADGANKLVEKAKADAAAIVDTDTTILTSQIVEADGINVKVRANKSRADLKKKYDDATLEADLLTGKIEAIDKEKIDQLSKAKFPIPEISFNEDGVLLNGVPFEQGSTAMQIRASMAIALATNPGLRIVLVREASLLDKNSLAIVAEMAAEHEAQIWLEIVGNPEGATVIIEDGSVKS